MAGVSCQFQEGCDGNRASPKMTTVRDLRRVLLTYLDSHPNSQVPIPKVTKGTFQDAESLFGVDLNREVKLRLPGRHAGSVQLQQFDPNFRSPEVFCRHPSCHNRNPDAEQRGNKRDLYLCQTHLDKLKSKIAQKLEVVRESFSLSMEDHEQEDLAEYTSLIGLLEAVFHDSESNSPVILEAILNVRNFLIITSTVLNPDAGTAVPLVALILRLILQNEHPDYLLSVLREVIELILTAFGIIYSWIWKTTATSSASYAPIGGALVGAGCIGAALECTPKPSWDDLLLVGLFGAAVGGLFGAACGYSLGQIAEIIENDRENTRKQKIISGFVTGTTVVYDFHGDAHGTLELRVCTHICNLSQ